MKKDKKVFILIEVVLAMLVLIVLLFMFQERADQGVKKIAVVVPNSDHSRWASFKYGLQMAETDFDVETVVVSTGETLTEEEEAALMESEIDNGADGILVQPAAGDDMRETLERIGKKTPVVQVESTVYTDEENVKIASVEPEHYAMGKTLAEEILLDYNGSLGGKTIGILSGDKGSAASEERKAGLTAGLKDAGGEILWSVDGYLDAEEILSPAAYPRVDIIVALDDSSFVAVGEINAKGSLNGAVLYGIGSSTEAFYYLDNGFAECLVVPDEFHVGYQGLAVLADDLRDSHKAEDYPEVAYTTVRRETLFTEENQNILFTMIQ